jgi:hypothetical protein
MSSTSSVTDSLQGQDTDVDRDHDAVAEGNSEDGGGYDSSDSSDDDSSSSSEDEDGAHDHAHPEGELGDDLSAMPVHSLTAINNSESGSIVNVPRNTFSIPDDQRSVASSVWSTEACTSVKSLRVQRDKKDERQSSSSSSSSQMPSLIRQRNQASTHSQDGSVEDEQRMQQQKHGDSDTASGRDGDIDAIALLDMSSSPELPRNGTSSTRLRFSFIEDTEEDARQSSNDAKIPRAESVTSEGSSSKSQHMEQVESCTDKSKDDGDDMDSQVDVDEEFVGGQSSNSPGKDNDDVADEDSTKSDDDESIGDKSQTEDALQARINAMLLDSDSSDDDSVDSGSDGGNSQV